MESKTIHRLLEVDPRQVGDPEVVQTGGVVGLRCTGHRVRTRGTSMATCRNNSAKSGGIAYDSGAHWAHRTDAGNDSRCLACMFEGPPGVNLFIEDR